MDFFIDAAAGANCVDARSAAARLLG